MKSFFFLTVLLIPAAHAAVSNCDGPAKSETIDVPGHPFAVQSTHDGCWLFVTLDEGKSKGAIGVLRRVANRFVLDHEVSIDANLFGASLSHDDATLAVAAGDETIVMDTAALLRGDTNPIANRIRNGRKAGAIYTALTADDKLLFVSEEDEKRISVFDWQKARHDTSHVDPLIARIPTTTAPVGLALSADQHWLFATSEIGLPTAANSTTCEPEMRNGRRHAPGLLLVVDVRSVEGNASHSLLGGYPAGCNPVRVAGSPDGKAVWVTARGGNQLVRFQVADWTSEKNVTSSTFTIGKNPVGLAVRPDGKQVWVALSDRFGNDADGKLAGLADAREQTPSTVFSAPAPGFPREIIFLPDGRTIVATLFDGKKIEVVNTPD